MTLLETIGLWKDVQEGKRDKKELADILVDQESRTLLASFVHETQKRSELIELIKIEDTLKDYLQLSTDERQQIEELRQQSPEYMQGEFVKSPISSRIQNKPRSLSASAFELFRNISDQKNIAKIVDAYVNKQPTNNFEQPVSLTTWFKSYDMNATYLTPKKEGKSEYLGSPPGHKHYLHWRKNIKPTGVEFDDWIESQITPELKERLQQTSYYQQEKLSITQIVQAYIDKQPTNEFEKTVSLTTWFQKYDMNAKYLTPKKDGKTERLGTAPGDKHYQHWYKKIKPTGVEFDNWIEQQLDEEHVKLNLDVDVRAQLEQTEYYIQKRSEEVQDQ